MVECRNCGIHMPNTWGLGVCGPCNVAERQKELDSARDLLRIAKTAWMGEWVEFNKPSLRSRAVLCNICTTFDNWINGKHQDITCRNAGYCIREWTILGDTPEQTLEEG